MAIYLFVFIIELIITLLVFFILRKGLPRQNMFFLSLVAVAIGLAAGWNVGYGVAANTVQREVIYAEEHRLNVAILSSEQAGELINKLKENPEYYQFVRNGTNKSAFPPIFVVLLIMVARARKHERVRKVKAQVMAKTQK